MACTPIYSYSLWRIFAMADPNRNVRSCRNSTCKLWRSYEKNNKKLNCRKETIRLLYRSIFVSWAFNDVSTTNDAILAGEQEGQKVKETRNTFCGTLYLPHSHVHNERTVPTIMDGCMAHARKGHISTSGLKSDVTIVFLGPDFL